MSANDRVRKHRAKLLSEQRCRLEIYVGIAFIDKVRQIAKLADKSIRSVVEDALETYIGEYDKLLLEQQGLNDERARVLALMEKVGSSQCGTQIDHYNQQLAAFNERLARFQGL